MKESMVPLNLPPGVYRNGTKYQTKGRWYDAQLVRWSRGILGPVGGWQALQLTTTDAVVVDGIPRAMHAWRINTGGRWLAVGTIGSGTTKVSAYHDGVVYDITPPGLVDGLPNGEYTSASGGLYGDGLYGAGPFGEPSGLTLAPPDTWQFDNFGEDLVGVCSSDEVVYYWDAVIGHAMTVAPNAPTARGLVVTPENFLMLLGAGGDGRKVQWPSLGTGLAGTTSDDWTPSDTNTAGGVDLATEGLLVTGRISRGFTMIWSDHDLIGAQFVGGEDIYAFTQLADNCGLVGPEAVAMVGPVPYWMSQGKFLTYDGALREVPCDVWEYVFLNINRAQWAKVQAVPNAQYNEVTWYFPSAASNENDLYVTYNYVENTWTIGALGRAAGVDRGIFDYPILVDPLGNAYEHERGTEHGGLTPYVESGPMELGLVSKVGSYGAQYQGDFGNELARVQHIVPDDKTVGDDPSAAYSPSVAATFYVTNYPTNPEQTKGPYSLANPTAVRFTARQIRVRITQVRPTLWRVGTIRLGCLPGGRR